MGNDDEDDPLVPVTRQGLASDTPVSPARSVPVTPELEARYSKMHEGLPPAKWKKRRQWQQTWGFKKRVRWDPTS
jgi:hypothetical protein